MDTAETSRRVFGKDRLDRAHDVRFAANRDSLAALERAARGAVCRSAGGRRPSVQGAGASCVLPADKIEAGLLRLKQVTGASVARLDGRVRSLPGAHPFSGGVRLLPLPAVRRWRCPAPSGRHLVKEVTDGLVPAEQRRRGVGRLRRYGAEMGWFDYPLKPCHRDWKSPAWRRRESNPRPQPHRVSIYKLRLPFRFARRPGCSRPTDGLVILWCRAPGD